MNFTLYLNISIIFIFNFIICCGNFKKLEISLLISNEET